jgi:hypothetical protein
MASSTPLTSLTLSASSVADDLGYVALDDLARAPGDIAADYRVTGGHMVTTLVARWQLGAELYRETGDLDLGIPPVVARDQHVVSRLKDIKYKQIAGNRFARKLADIPAGMTSDLNAPDPDALIDVSFPPTQAAYSAAIARMSSSETNAARTPTGSGSATRRRVQRSAIFPGFDGPARGRRVAGDRLCRI